MHTSHTPDDWFVPVDALPPILMLLTGIGAPVAMVNEATGEGRLLIPSHISIDEAGAPTCTNTIVQEYAPSGMPADRYQSILFACACGNCPPLPLQFGVN